MREYDSTVQCIQKITQNFLEIFSYSGHSLFQQGQYEQCIQHLPVLKYNYVSLYDPTASTWVGATIGLCLPRQCQKSLISSSINQVFQLANQPFRVYSINDKVQDQSYQYDYLFWLTIIILLILLTLVMIGTYIDKKYNRKQRIIQSKEKKYISSFSLLKSKHIFQYKDGSSLYVLNGIKSLSMMWVVFGHQYVFGLTHSSNILTYQHILLQPFFLIVQSGLIAVDTFFFVGGFLVTYSIIKNIKNNKKGFKFYLLAILQRALRFWPSYIVIILIYYSIYLHLGTGPQWINQQVSVSYCSKMWKPLIFMDNIIDNGQSMCISWGWYLQNDMQLFFVSVLILYWYSQRSRIQGKFILFLLVLGSFFFNFYQAQINQYKVNTHMKDFSVWGKYFNDIYIKPWGRCPPYFYGVFFGMIYVEQIQKNKQNKQAPTQILQNQQETEIKNGLINQTFNISNSKTLLITNLKIYFHQKSKYHCLIQQMFGLSISTFIIFIPRTLQVYGTEFWPQIVHSSYLSIGKFIFVVGLSIAIYPSLLNTKQRKHQMSSKPLLSMILDTRIFSFLSKILFWIYLIHLLFIFQFDGSLKYDSYFNVVNLFTLFCGHLVISVPFALIFTLVVQLPFSRIQKLLMDKIFNKKSNPMKQDIL